MEIEKAHIEEMNCFNIEWDKIVTELHEQIAKMEEDLIRRHEEQLVSALVIIATCWRGY